MNTIEDIKLIKNIYILITSTLYYKSFQGISQLYKSHNRPSSEERLYYLANEHSSNEGEVQTDQRTVSRPRFQFKRRSSSFIPSRGYNSDVPYDDN